MGNKYWRTIDTSKDKIYVTKTGWTVGNKTVYWNLKEAAEAQRWLRAHDRKKKQRKRR